MARKHFFESEEAYQERAKKEFLEVKSGLKKGIFESEHEYETRAKREILEKSTGDQL